VSEATSISWALDRLNVPFPVVKKVRSGESSTVFEIASGDQRWFLKIGRQLAPECAWLRWLRGRLATPAVVAFDPVGDREALLMSAVPGLIWRSWRNG
jgi:aminoglycoside phosphotransferase